MPRQLVRALFLFTVIAVAVGIDGAHATQSGGARIPIRLADGATPESVVVEAGDNLWKISAQHLSEIQSEAPLGPYWRQVIADNTSDLKSGDPNLIYPGEMISLPPPSG